MLVRSSVVDLFTLAERHPEKALWCVQHQHEPHETRKMDGQTQSKYHRKNWSSVMLFNCEHRAHKALTFDLINHKPGRDLHRFCWLHDDDIGALDPRWNYLVGEQEEVGEPKIVHFTTGAPYMTGHENDPYADEWFAELTRWAA